MKNVVKKRKINISKDFPFLVLIRLISLYGYKNEILQWNNEYVTVNKVCKMLNINSTMFDKSLNILQYFNLCYEVDVNGKRCIAINSKMIKLIDKSYLIKKAYKGSL